MQHKWAKEIKAWADGAELEWNWSAETPDYRVAGGKENHGWKKVIMNPRFDDNEFQYRIKPQPKEPQEENRYKKWEKEVKHFLAGGKVKAINLGISGLKGTVKHVAAFDDPNYIFEIEKEPKYLYVYKSENNRKIHFSTGIENNILLEYIGKIKLEQDDGSA